jgi:hypothetical protein
MAGRANEGFLRGLSLGLDLLPSNMCAGFRTLSLASVQKLGSRDPHLMKLSLDKNEISMVNYESEKMF